MCEYMYSSLCYLDLGGVLRKWKAGTKEKAATHLFWASTAHHNIRKAVEDMLCPQFNGFTEMTADSGVSYNAYVTATKQRFDRMG